MKNGLAITLLIIPILITAMFGVSTFAQRLSFDQPRLYTHYMEQRDNKTNETYGTCSAVLIAKDTILTAYHCVINPKDDTRSMYVSGFLAKLLRYDEINDLALLSVPGIDCPCSPLAAESPDTDEHVLAVGWPLGRAEVATEGNMQSIIEVQTALGKAYRNLNTTQIVFGNSGGGLYSFNYGRWELVGITVAVEGADLGFFGVPVFGMTHSVPIETVRDFVLRK